MTKKERQTIIDTHLTCISFSMNEFHREGKPARQVKALIRDIQHSVTIIDEMLKGHPLPKMVVYKKNGRWHSKLIKMALSMAPAVRRS